MDKVKKLKSILKDMGSVLVAYSGGVDSTFLLKVCFQALGDNVLAVTASSATYPAQELLLARKTVRAIGSRHLVIKTGELTDRRFTVNNPRRCYYCKSELFGALKSLAKAKKLNFVIDASNASDRHDYRPGAQAKRLAGVRSPLEEAGFTKEDIRRASRKMKLATWDKPSLACLASRIPYGTAITPALLDRIDKAEKFLRGLGFLHVRLRHYNGLCRIEVAEKDIAAAVAQRDRITRRLKALGYRYVTVDLQGYRCGSMNEVLRIKKARRRP
ncbi:MAG TPA: ATP-dependent sacrificial sulfur transferase LarE [Patescibacteria group bacterium]|nr:ATP-dependent sacrificial sulfur transferase LarE [Patescibacteria group bacterium]